MSNVYDLARQRFTKRRTGTMYASPSAAELGIEYLLHAVGRPEGALYMGGTGGLKAARYIRT